MTDQPDDNQEIDRLLAEVVALSEAALSNYRAVDYEPVIPLLLMGHSPQELFDELRSEANVLKHPAEHKDIEPKEIEKSFVLKAEAIAEHARVSRSPKYSTEEFKCIGDYDKCVKHRGKKSPLCSLALIVCVLKHIVPMAGQIKKVVSD